jgi:hypothetical protein
MAFGCSISLPHLSNPRVSADKIEKNPKTTRTQVGPQRHMFTKFILQLDVVFKKNDG